MSSLITAIANRLRGGGEPREDGGFSFSIFVARASDFRLNGWVDLLLQFLQRLTFNLPYPFS